MPVSDCSMTALWGDEHPDLGNVAVAALDPGMALALSRGRFPKAYRHVDPNEDAALAVSGPGGRLLAVADGHNGFEAARAAVEAVAQKAPALLDRGTDPEAALRTVFATAGRAIAAAVAGAPGPRRSSRTALSLVLIGESEAWTATLGDTAVIRVRGDRTKLLSDELPFLGPNSPAPPVEAVKLRERDRLLVVSDGVIDFLGTSWATRLGEAVAAAPGAERCARQLVDLALAGGAGDNVAVAAAWPGD